MGIQNIDMATPTSTQRHLIIQNPDSAFFTTFRHAYAQYEAASHSHQSVTDNAIGSKEASALARVMGPTFNEMASRRQTGIDDQSGYAAILYQAYTQGGMDDPVAFLKNLSPQQQGIVQRVHCLADAIDPVTISKEGAYNLLLPDGYRVDFNHDGVQEVGAGKAVTFPPLDAPAQVKQAWLTATKDMNEGDMLTYQLEMHLMMYGMPIGGEQQKALAATDQIDSYREGVDKFLDWLEFVKASLPSRQYRRDKAFFSEMKRLLA